MIKIPAGSFTFGTSEQEFDAYVSRSLVNFSGMREKLREQFLIPRRTVTLPEFQIDQFEVSNEQYLEFVKASGYWPANPVDYLKGWTSPTTTFPSWAATFPVVWVSFEDAQAYCIWRGVRLPTEEEWEKAARGKDGRIFPWGGKFPNKEEVNYGSSQAEPVGNRPFDKSPYDLYDLGGNVSEVTISMDGKTAQSRVVVRGGSYLSAGRDTVTVKRTLVPPSARSATVGFRCAR
jgi:formylglycine-generating enzyme